ncbi:MAG: hypothetical protein VYA53_02720 [Acidobacteriota bacterium]|nr:hypothetical protein [Acidobacteriota bacterium]
MPGRFLRIFCLFVVALTMMISSVVSQTFSLSSTPTIVSSTDLMALSGKLTFEVTSGTTAAGYLMVDYGGVVIANTTSTGITVADTCSGSASVFSVDQAGGIITISVPSGCVTGKTVTLDGVRFDVPAGGFSSVAVNVTIPSGTAFALAANTTQATVISAVKDGLVVAADSDTVLTYKTYPQGVGFESQALFFNVSEGFSTAFRSSLTLGQTLATRVRLEVTGLPADSRLVFPSTITDAASGGTLTVVSGEEVTFPRTSGNTTLSYYFTAGASSAVKEDTFKIEYKLYVDNPPAEDAVVFLQASLFPFDSPNIPRYVSTLLPSESDLTLPVFDNYLPGQGTDGQFTSIAFTNPSSHAVKVQLDVFAPDGVAVTGSNITNPVTLTLSALEQKAMLLEEIFGSGIKTAVVGTIRARTRRSRTVSFFMQGDNNSVFLDGATTGQDRLTAFLFSNIGHEGVSPSTSVNIVNPSTSASVDVEMSLYNSAGVAQSSKTETISAGGTFSKSLIDLFGFDTSSLSGGYVRGTATGDIVAFESFGDSETLNVLNAQNPGLKAEKYCIPYFAVGAGYDTEINVINTESTRAATINIWAMDSNGEALGVLTNPVKVTLQAGEQKVLSMASSFGLLSDSATLTTGSLRIDVVSNFIGFFPVLPTISGSVRFATQAPPAAGRLSASLLLRNTINPNVIYPHVAQTAGSLYTGVAMVNSLTNSVKQTLEVFNKTGVLVGSTAFTLAPGEMKTALVEELVPLSAGQSGGYFRLRGVAKRDVLGSGTHDASSGEANLTDTLTNFLKLGVTRSVDIIRNVTDGSEAVIIKVEESVITSIALSGGADNYWDNGDQWEIVTGAKPGVISFALFGDLTGQYLSVIPAQ